MFEKLHILVWEIRKRGRILSMALLRGSSQVHGVLTHSPNPSKSNTLPLSNLDWSTCHPLEPPFPSSLRFRVAADAPTPAKIGFVGRCHFTLMWQQRPTTD